MAMILLCDVRKLELNERQLENIFYGLHVTEHTQNVTFYRLKPWSISTTILEKWIQALTTVVLKFVVMGNILWVLFNFLLHFHFQVVFKC
ncbi:hypothetical protein EUGRSUZ_J02974 [Eucalyptus grandis]|uniref:Uncharacterized protein n=2 Tax=Eucalyptus grandis TaxID=71139 RepID=A0A059AI43_EUCGR|nr:hypothetical protein EUGRSUZ_J02974 [Eucalyptus grandis]